MEARGAIARRNRVLKIYGIILLAGALGLVGYCALRPGFDLSTPERTMKTFKRSLDKHRWSEAEKCLTTGCHDHYAQSIADRRLFDFYSPYGYETDFGKFIPDWRVRKVETDGDKAQAWVASGMPLVREDQAGFYIHMVRDKDNLWRIDGPRENVALWYEKMIPERAKGWAAAEEEK